MNYFVKGAKIIGLGLEIKKTVLIGEIPQRANQGHEGTLACAVFPDKEGQGCKTHCLKATKSTEVPQ